MKRKTFFDIFLLGNEIKKRRLGWLQLLYILVFIKWFKTQRSQKKTENRKNVSLKTPTCVLPLSGKKVFFRLKLNAEGNNSTNIHLNAKQSIILAEREKRRRQNGMKKRSFSSTNNSIQTSLSIPKHCLSLSVGKRSECVCTKESERER
jgi:hypothetical protein